MRLYKKVILLSLLWGSALTTFATPTNQIVVDDNFQVSSYVQGDSIFFNFTLKNNYSGWMVLIFHESYFPADTIAVWIDNETGKPIVWDAYNPAIPTLESFPSPMLDTNQLFMIPGDSDSLNNKENVKLVSFSNNDGVINIKVTRKLYTGDIFDYQFRMGNQVDVVAGYDKTRTFNQDAADAPQPGFPFGGTFSKPALWTISNQ